MSPSNSTVFMLLYLDSMHQCVYPCKSIVACGRPCSLPANHDATEVTIREWYRKAASQLVLM